MAIEARPTHRIESDDRKSWTTLILLGIAQFMVILDIIVVNVALPSIAFLPLVLVIAAGANVAKRVIARMGSRTLAAVGLLLVSAGAALLAIAPHVASYGTDVLPGFVVLGFGVGVVFPAGSIAAMSEVGEETAGLASGLIATGHELGAAFGVAAVSAVATGATTLVAGYADGVVAVAAVAAFVALVAILATPSARPDTAARAGAHA